mmetsp:Transcript_78622/g.230714  ORF Transcript_78622/g.230714 Transcript_78622/m.230714 type:complete len:505 (+) Transcript_78622:55-1569(+)
MPPSRQLAARLFAGLLPLTLGQPFTFSAPKHACGVCRELLNGLPCEHFGACHVVNASAAQRRCADFCGSPVATERDEVVPTRRLASSPDVRVVRGFGTKGYDQIRISVVSQEADPPMDGFFDYSAQFKYRWTDNFLHSAMKSAIPGKVTSFPLGPGLSVRLPRQGDGTAGVLIGDPCMSAGSIIGWIGCMYGGRFNTYERTVSLLNAFVPDESTDYWGILGDNFYDRTGDISAEVFSRLSMEAKSKFFITVPGNHDFWIMGSPTVATVADQCANGFMQFYAQDAKAAEAVTAGNTLAPFNFTVDPSDGRHFGLGCNLPAMSNMFWYHQIGNVGLVGQSGAHDLEEAQPFMVEACAWLAQQPGLQVAVLVGHWDNQLLGVSTDMGMPHWYHKMAALPGCSDLDQRGMLKYVMGHTHCNEPHPRGDVGAGFRVGGFGMNGCGNFGIPVLDTTESRVRFWYFDTSSDDSYNAVIKCVGQKGWRQCLDLATTWLDQPIPQSSYEQVLI